MSEELRQRFLSTTETLCYNNWMSFFDFSNKPKKKVGIVLDIGSKTVGGAIYDTDAEGNVVILYSTREPIAFQKRLTSESLLLALMHSIELVLIHLEKYGLKHLNKESKYNYQVSSVAGVFSSPWHISETKTIKFSQENSFVVTEKLVSGLMEKEEKEFVKRLTKGESTNSRFNVLEHAVIEMRLNGYPTTEPYGKNGNALELQIFTSVSLANIYNKVDTLVHKHFPVEHFTAHTFTLTAFATIRDYYPNILDFFTVQVGGEVTDITIVKKGIIADTISFPMGYNHLLRSLNGICKDHIECTLEGLLAIHHRAKINSTDKKKVEKAILETKVAWGELFNNSISNFSLVAFLPKSVFLFQDGPYLSLFEEFLRSIESGQLSVASERFEVHSVNDVRALLRIPPVENAVDSILVLEANFIAKSHRTKSL